VENSEELAAPPPAGSDARQTPRISVTIVGDPKRLFEKLQREAATIGELIRELRDEYDCDYDELLDVIPLDNPDYSDGTIKELVETAREGGLFGIDVFHAAAAKRAAQRLAASGAVARPQTNVNACCMRARSRAPRRGRRVAARAATGSRGSPRRSGDDPEPPPLALVALGEGRR
jgi:hypothetical protein